jgi:hypothetical protein
MRWHELRTAGRMRLRILLVAACLAVFAEPLFAQGWRTAVERQDYATASRLLHQAVLALPDGQHDPEPLAAEALANLYAAGLGVPADPIASCAFMFWAGASAGVSAADGGGDSQARRLNALAAERCATLGVEERAQAGSMAGCFVFDVPPEMFSLGPGHSVQITRTGLRIFHGGSVVDEEVSPFGCHRQMSLVRYRPVLTPGRDGALTTRHFVEFFAWTSVHLRGKPLRTLSWVLVEVVGGSAQHREVEVVAELTSPAWPPDHPAVAPPDIELTALADGGIAWRIATRPARSGVVEPLRDAR